MTRALFAVSIRSLMRDRLALALTFALPIAFFTIFAFIMPTGSDPMSGFTIAVADLDNSNASRSLISALKIEPAIEKLLLNTKVDDATRPLTRADVEQLVKSGKLEVAICIPEGFETGFGLFFDPGGSRKAIEIFTDPANPIAPQVLNGLLQKNAMSAAPDLMMDRGMQMFDQFIGITPEQRPRIEESMRTLKQLRQQDNTTGQDSDSGKSATADGGFTGPVATTIVNVRNDRGARANSLIALTAANNAVLFLLFAAAGAGGVLLDYREQGVLARLLGSRLSMTSLILGHWFFIGLVGIVQIATMFLWGWLLFKVDLFGGNNLPGFLIVTTFTSFAAAALGVLLAAACKSRAQLSGISTLVILTMSAVGGSMFPRFIMPDVVKNIGLGTFNGWALDAYYQVFHYSDPNGTLMALIRDIGLELGVLAGMTVAFLLIARILARRWECA